MVSRIQILGTVEDTDNVITVVLAPHCAWFHLDAQVTVDYSRCLDADMSCRGAQSYDAFLCL